MARPRKAATEYEDAAAQAPAIENSGTWSDWIDARARIDALPADRRDALILPQVLGYTYEEAAKIAGVRVATTSPEGKVGDACVVMFGVVFHHHELTSMTVDSDFAVNNIG